MGLTWLTREGFPSLSPRGDRALAFALFQKVSTLLGFSKDGSDEWLVYPEP